MTAPKGQVSHYMKWVHLNGPPPHPKEIPKHFPQNCPPKLQRIGRNPSFFFGDLGCRDLFPKPETPKRARTDRF
eukprot:6488409-Amphidinium_carterae.1